MTRCPHCNATLTARTAAPYLEGRKACPYQAAGYPPGVRERAAVRIARRARQRQGVRSV